MNYSSLEKYYEDLFVMKYDHGFDISEMERLAPFERDLLFTMINGRIQNDSETKRLIEKQQEAIRNARPRF